MSARARLARGLVGLYPCAWRARYQEEMLALLEDDPPGPRGLASLLAGAADAHLRPRASWRAALPPAVRMRASACGLFACWIGLSLAGVAFQKLTEDQPFATAASHHWLLDAGRGAILAGALLGAVAIALPGAPLLAHAALRAWQTRDRRLAWLLAAPALAGAAFGAVTLLLLVLAPARNGGFPLSFVLSVLVPWLLAGLAWAAVCAYAPRAVLARSGPSAQSLRRAARAAPLLVAAMTMVSAGILVYAGALAAGAPALSGEASGPVGASTGATLAASAAVAVLCTGLGLLAAVRARRAALEHAAG